MIHWIYLSTETNLFYSNWHKHLIHNQLFKFIGLTIDCKTDITFNLSLIQMVEILNSIELEYIHLFENELSKPYNGSFQIEIDFLGRICTINKGTKFGRYALELITFYKFLNMVILKNEIILVDVYPKLEFYEVYITSYLSGRLYFRNKGGDTFVNIYNYLNNILGENIIQNLSILDNLIQLKIIKIVDELISLTDRGKRTSCLKNLFID